MLNQWVSRLSSSSDYLNTSCQHEIEISRDETNNQQFQGKKRLLWEAIWRWSEGNSILFKEVIHKVFSAASWNCTLKFIWIFETLHCEIKNASTKSIKQLTYGTMVTKGRKRLISWLDNLKSLSSGHTLF